MKAVVLAEPGLVLVESVPEPAPSIETVRLKVRMIGLCGSDLNSFRGTNPLVAFPRIIGHEVAATLEEDVDD